MTIRVNGAERALSAATVAELVERLGVTPAMRHVAVAINGDVVPRGAWDRTPLVPGDDVEVVRPFSGG